MRLVLLPALLLLLLATSPAHAAQSYDNCTGFIDSVPATITTQGVWCLRADLSTAIASGDAINVATNNVTIDCNQFKLGGLAAGVETQARGIAAFDRLNTTIRNCNVRGFLIGALVIGGSGHVVEDNLFDGITTTGIWVNGDGSSVRRNRVVDTGGNPGQVSSFGIYGQSDVEVIDNSVTGVFALGTGAGAHGIVLSSSPQGIVAGNRVRGLVVPPGGVSFGIWLEGAGRAAAMDNVLLAIGTGQNNTGIICGSPSMTARNNTLSGFSVDVAGCGAVGNYTNNN